MKLGKRLSVVMVALALLAGGAQSAFAALSADQRQADFSELVSVIQRSYGPLKWKQELHHLDFNKLVADYRARIAVAKGDGEFYRLLAAFLAELKDAHVSSIVPSNYKATLGFSVDVVQGKVLIEQVDTLKLPPPLFPFKKGDQLLALGGVPVDQLLDQLSRVTNTGFDKSTRRIAAARLTTRKEANGFEVPRGVTTVTVLPKGATEPVTVTATWAASGTPVMDLDDLSTFAMMSDLGAVPTAASGNEFLNAIKKNPIFSSRMPQEVLSDLRSAGISDVGAPKSMFKLPANAKELADVSVTAAVYEAAGKRIGVLRINSYDDDGLLDELARALQQMKDSTDVLVLDQTNNPGGSVSLVSDIVGLFATKSFKDMDFVIRPSLPWLQSFQEMNSKIEDILKEDPESMAANALKARFAYLEGEVRDAIQQRRFLTAPVSLNLTGSFGMIQPNDHVAYAKPVLLLINEFDFSGGDAFPALMKDNGRVTTFGVRTTGAGGNVREYGPLANSFFKFRLTESLMVRPNGEYVENLGVKADVPYEVTEDDFNNGYQGYVKAFTVEALKLAGASAEEIKKYQEGGN